MNALRAAGLTKRYGHTAVVDGLDLTVERGELYGFLGPNGAGKTTTIRMALGLIHPSGGEVELLGERVGTHAHLEALARAGALIEEPGFYRYLSGRRNLISFARAGGLAPGRGVAFAPCRRRDGTGRPRGCPEQASQGLQPGDASA
ncbi:MAG: ATP-binding cassette domain-containing protein, partial [Actinomycetota bacterium]